MRIPDKDTYWNRMRMCYWLTWKRVDPWGGVTWWDIWEALEGLASLALLPFGFIAHWIWSFGVRPLFAPKRHAYESLKEAVQAELRSSEPPSL